MKIRSKIFIFAMMCLVIPITANAKTYDCSAGGFYEKCNKKPPSDYKFWVKMAQCHSPGKGKWGVKWSYRKNNQEGAFHFHPSTWNTWRKDSFASRAFKANWREQMYVARGIKKYNAGWVCPK